MKCQVKATVLVSGILLTLLLAILATIHTQTVLARTYNMGTFTFEIPRGCKVDKEKNRFQTDSTHLNCGNNKEIAFEISDLVNLDATPVADLENILTTVYDGAKIFESGVDKYTINNHTAPYALATWTHTGHNLFGAELTKDVAGMAIAIKVGDQVVIGQYLAPTQDFDKFLKKAEATFESVKATGSGSSSATGNETGIGVSGGKDTNAE